MPPSHVHDAALADLVADRARAQERRHALWDPAFLDELAQAHRVAAITAMVAILATASTVGAAWRLRSRPFRWRPPMPSRH